MTMLPDTAAYQVVQLRHRLNKGQIRETFDQTMQRYGTTYDELCEFLGPLAVMCLRAPTVEAIPARIIGMTAQAIAVAVELVTNAEPGETARKPEHLPPAVLEVVRTARATHLAAASAFVSDAEGLLQATDPQAMRQLWADLEAASDKLGEALRDLEAAGTDTT